MSTFFWQANEKRKKDKKWNKINEWINELNGEWIKKKVETTTTIQDNSRHVQCVRIIYFSYFFSTFVSLHQAVLVFYYICKPGT